MYENNETCYSEFLKTFSTSLEFGPADEIQAAIGEFDVGHAVSQLFTLTAPDDLENFPVCRAGSDFYIADGRQSKMSAGTCNFIIRRESARYRLERGENVLAAIDVSLALKNYANARRYGRWDPLSILLTACRHIGIH